MRRRDPLRQVPRLAAVRRHAARNEEGEVKEGANGENREGGLFFRWSRFFFTGLVSLLFGALQFLGSAISTPGVPWVVSKAAGIV